MFCVGDLFRIWGSLILCHHPVLLTSRHFLHPHTSFKMDDHLRNIDRSGQVHDACHIAGVTRSCINKEAIAQTKLYLQAYPHP